jgi:spore germination protein GerM
VHDSLNFDGTSDKIKTHCLILCNNLINIPTGFNVLTYCYEWLKFWIDVMLARFVPHIIYTLLSFIPESKVYALIDWKMAILAKTPVNFTLRFGTDKLGYSL